MFTPRRILAVLAGLILPAALLLLLVAPLAGAQEPGQQAPLPPPPGAATRVALYVPGPPPMNRLLLLNPLTLEDLPNTPALRFDGGYFFDPIFSADRTTAACLDAGEIVVWDLRTNRERGHFYPHDAVTLLALSRDGSRLVAARTANLMDNPTLEGWATFDTTTGQRLSVVQAPSQVPQSVLVDPTAWRLYQQLSLGGAHTTRIVADDLATGKQLGQVDLPGVVTGVWKTGQYLGGEPVTEAYEAGLAVSPDGRLLAVVHPERDAVTLVNAQTLRVERTLRFGPRASIWQRLAELVPLWPQAAAAKASEGTIRDAVFAADGRHLYVWGGRSTLSDGQMQQHSFGLAVVDLATGATLGPVFADEDIDVVWPAPDGRSVYVVASLAQGPTRSAWLRRLDATSLRTLAQRSQTSEQGALGPILIGFAA